MERKGGMISQNLRDFLESDLSIIYDDGEKLLSTVNSGYSDYSFLVFPFAKVYEGFLKKFFYKIGAINQLQYESERWRVGKALNPQLEKDLRHESVYDFINPDLGNVLWEAWKNGRNKIFHYFPGQHAPLSFEKAKVIIKQLNDAMEMALDSLTYAPDFN